MNQKINKLEKEVIEVEQTDDLQKLQSQIIKNYQMKEGDYKVLITVYEANDLMPRGTDFLLFETEKTACDAFVEITVRDQIKKTNVKIQTNNPIFDEQFVFNFPPMSLQELDQSKITFTLYDKKNFIISDALVGNFELDWTNVYFKRNHEIYRGWLTLSDPNDQFQGVIGYLLVNIAVLGPTDQITVHDSAFIKDPLTTMQQTITSPKIQLIDFCINLQIYRAENLLPLDSISRSVDAFVVAKFSGNKIKTTTINSLNPEWNQMLKIGCGIPTKSKYITLEVWNRNTFIGNELLGIISIPFSEICEDEEFKPMWKHLYGPPISGKDIQPYNYASKMQIYGEKLGSHYRGRILIKVSGRKDIYTKNIRTPLKFNFPYKPACTIPLKAYTLHVDLIEGSHLSKCNKHQIQVAMGHYLMRSPNTYEAKNGSCEYFQTLEDKKMQFPQDVKQLPDIIVYLCDGPNEHNRMSFIRIKAVSIVTDCYLENSRIFEMIPDKSLGLLENDDAGGFLTLRLHLYTNLPPKPRKFHKEYTQKMSYVLKIFLYQGQGFPSANENGDCDPMINFDCCSQQCSSEVCKETFNPIWNQIITMQLHTQDLFDTSIEKALVCDAFDYEENNRNNFIGRFWLPLNCKMKSRLKCKSQKIQFIYSKPQWHYLINQSVSIGNNIFGRVLMCCALFKKSDYRKVPQQKFNHICTSSEDKIVELYLIGIRDMRREKQHLTSENVVAKLKIGTSDQIETEGGRNKNGGCEINKMYKFDVKIPKNRCLSPFIDIKIGANANGKTLWGYNSINLYDVIPKLKQKMFMDARQEQDEQETLLDVQQLQQQLELIRDKRRKQNQAIRNINQYKIMPINKLPTPNELGYQKQDTMDFTKNLEFNRLLEQFESTYKRDNVYDYIRQLEVKNDLKSVSNKSKNQIQLMQMQRNNDVQEYSKLMQHENDEEERQSMMPQLQRSNIQGVAKSKIQKQSRRTTIVKKKKKNEEEIQNNIKEIEKDYKDLQKRYGKEGEDHQNVESQTISDFELKEEQVFTKKEIHEKAIKYENVKKGILQEQEHEREARRREEEYKYAAAVKLSLFGWKKANKEEDRETYQDYDTDEEENLNIIPEWYKGRKILTSDFEDLAHKSKKIHSIAIYRGKKQTGIIQTRIKQQIATLKFIALSKPESIALEKQKYYSKLLKPKSYYCRIYVLKGKSLISKFDSKPSTFLKFQYGGQQFNMKNQTYHKNNHNPEYYVCYETAVELPGPSTIRIDVMQSHNVFGKLFNQTLGFTEIDLEQRYFMKKWHLFIDKKPIELRNLYSDYSMGSQGRLETWIELIDKKKWLSTPKHKIHPPPFDEYELRIIVWKTKDCVYKNNQLQSNDIFVRGKIGCSQHQQTDTHWACRAMGSFNYRFKFSVFYPPKPQDMYSDIFILQIWDRDIIGCNNLIGQTRINLNKIHKIIQKVVKRKKTVTASMKIKEKNLVLTDKFWFDVYNHLEKDQFGQLQSQGKAQLSFELVPIENAKNDLANGYGRSQPNVYPTLPEPVGRLSFDFLHPLNFLKDLLGPNLYQSVCCKLICCLVILIVVFFGFFLFTGILAQVIF